jgi:hypothetical protein
MSLNLAAFLSVFQTKSLRRQNAIFVASQTLPNLLKTFKNESMVACVAHMSRKNRELYEVETIFS